MNKKIGTILPSEHDRPCVLETESSSQDPGVRGSSLTVTTLNLR